MKILLHFYAVKLFAHACTKNSSYIRKIAIKSSENTTLHFLCNGCHCLFNWKFALFCFSGLKQEAKTEEKRWDFLFRYEQIQIGDRWGWSLWKNKFADSFQDRRIPNRTHTNNLRDGCGKVTSVCLSVCLSVSLYVCSSLHWCKSYF